MQETELHDLSDDADYAASQQQGSSSMMSTDSIKRSSSNEPDGSEIVYSKDNVAIHPTQFVSERISGRLKLIKQGSSLFMTWLPYKEQNSNAKQIEKAYVDRNLYTIKAVPFTEVRSIRKHAPPLGWQYVIIVLSSGLAFPPFYFYNGGVRQFLATIKQHVFLVRSAEDASVFLVNDFENPLQRTFSSLELPRVVSVASGQSTPISGDESPLKENQERINGYESSSISQYNGRQRQKVHDPARDISIQVLEKFSLVTKFARETTSQLFRDGHSNGFGSFEKMFDSQPAQDDLHKASNDVERVTDEIAVASDPLEFDKLSLVWGKPRQPPLGSEENFVKFLSGMNLKLEGKGGVHQDMVSYIPAQSNPNKVIIARLALSTVIPLILIGLLETVEEPDLLHTKVEPPPLSEEWATFLDNEGRVMDSEALRKRIFYGGVEHELRREVWGLLLGYYAYDSTYAEREYLRTIKKSEYETIKHQWQSISPEQARRFTKFRERKGLIDKDVVRTDRAFTFYDGDDNPNVNLLRDTLLTYSFYNFDLGYCQGMSDLMSPILFVMEDESESFWCFVQLMERLGPNFNRDQSGMHSQLFALSKLVELLDSPLHNYFKQNECLNYFFCFRWLLIQFKREFEYEETMRLWEVLWTHYLSEHLHLYVCVAVLKRYRRKIMGEQMDFDTLLKFINELSGRINLDAILRDAEALCICAGENGAANIPPGTPPSLPIDSGLFYSQQEDEVL